MKITECPYCTLDSEGQHDVYFTAMAEDGILALSGMDTPPKRLDAEQKLLRPKVLKGA